jgi:hypothetical protein
MRVAGPTLEVPGLSLAAQSAVPAGTPPAGYYRLEMDANGIMWAVDAAGNSYPLPAAPNTLDNALLRVNQRAIASATFAGFATDRWYYANGSALTFSLAVQAAAPTALQARVGAQSSLRLSRSSGAAATVAGSYEGIWQSIVGHDWQRHHGQPNVVSFWARSSKAGTYGISLTNGVDRTYPGTFTITTPATWEFKVKVFPAVTAGTWLFTNGLGGRLMFTALAGSNFQGTPNSWNSDTLWAPNTISNLLTAAGDYLDICAPKFEPGILPTTFAAPDYPNELDRCQYFDEVIGSGGVNQAFEIGFQAATTVAYGTILHRKKRVYPTLTYSALADFIFSTTGVPTSLSATQQDYDRFFLVIGTPTVAAGSVGFFYANNANARLYLDARLV